MAVERKKRERKGERRALKVSETRLPTVEIKWRF